MIRFRAVRLLPCVLTLLFIAVSAIAQGSPPTGGLSFAVTYDASITDSYTGRVYVMLSASESGEPRMGSRWSHTEPFFAVDVTYWKPGDVLRFDSSRRTLSFPGPMRALEQDDHTVQAVMRRNLDSHTIGSGQGTGYSTKITQNFNGADDKTVALHITEVAESRDPAAHPMFSKMFDSGRLQHVRMRSDMLSDFHGRDIHLEAAVLLPESYLEKENAGREYPALYLIPGFGGSEFQGVYMATMNRDDNANQIVKIGLDSDIRTGHHVFANSANNGPYADALVEEFIPYLEQQFRLTAAPHGRYLTGISSGGWSSLWLQIQYPQFFGGTWSFVPDPVDFRKFQTVDIYADDANIYRDQQGKRRPLGRQGDTVFIWADDFGRMEHVMGEGGQLHSFEAVFSPKGNDGKPMPLYDRETGAIDSNVAEAWRVYDIRLVLEEQWPRIGKSLQGKLHIIAGEDDNFYLEDAVKLLRESLQELGSDAEVEVLEGRNHGSAPSPDRFKRLDEQLLEMYQSTADIG